MILEKFPEVGRLTPSEKLAFVSELWNDLEAHPSEVPVSRETIAELDRRRAALTFCVNIRRLFPFMTAGIAQSALGIFQRKEQDHRVF
jgi:putative addiction module component (TIGR02574 family)